MPFDSESRQRSYAELEREFNDRTFTLRDVQRIASFARLEGAPSTLEIIDDLDKRDRAREVDPLAS